MSRRLEPWDAEYVRREEALREEDTVTDAAERLGITQSSLSHWVRRYGREDLVKNGLEDWRVMLARRRALAEQPGATIASIAKKEGVGWMAIYAYCQYHGIEVESTPTHFHDDDEARRFEAWLGGGSDSSIANRLGVDYDSWLGWRRRRLLPKPRPGRVSGEQLERDREAWEDRFWVRVGEVRDSPAYGSFE